MTLKNKIITSSLLVVALLIAVFIVAINIVAINRIQPSASLGDNAPATFDSANMTSSVVTLRGGAATGTALFVLGNIFPTGGATSNPNRHFGQIQNYGSNPAFCIMNSTSSALTSSTFGFVLQPSSTVNSEWNTQPTGGNEYVGQVWCIAGTATTTISVEEAN